MLWCLLVSYVFLKYTYTRALSPCAVSSCTRRIRPSCRLEFVPHRSGHPRLGSTAHRQARRVRGANGRQETVARLRSTAASPKTRGKTAIFHTKERHADEREKMWRCYTKRQLRRISQNLLRWRVCFLRVSRQQIEKTSTYLARIYSLLSLRWTH